MISQEKSYILTTLQKLPKNVRALGKLIVAKGFKKSPKVQKIAQSGHTGHKIGRSKVNVEQLDTLPIIAETSRPSTYQSIYLGALFKENRAYLRVSQWLGALV